VPIKLDFTKASRVLVAAFDARLEAVLPIEWVSFSRSVFGLTAKTYVPVFATLLLAKATDRRVDVMSIKEAGDHSYSLRTLGERVIVPASGRLGFSLKTTGPNPFNNGEFHKHDRLDQMERVRNPTQHAEFLAIVERANTLDEAEASRALSAFLKVASDEALKIRSIAIRASKITATDLYAAVTDFMRLDAPERPKRLQAFAAACLDLLYRDVRSRRLNDPSRDVPGDVQVYADKQLILSMEVKGRSIPSTEFRAFIDRCIESGIGRVILLVDHPSHVSLVEFMLGLQDAESANMQINVFESSVGLARSALEWSSLPFEDAPLVLAQRMLERLKEIEAPVETLGEWSRAIGVMQNR